MPVFLKKVKGDGAGIRQVFLEQMTFVFGSVLRFKFQYQLFDPYTQLFQSHLTIFFINIKSVGT